jgi:hypothetical protein
MLQPQMAVEAGGLPSGGMCTGPLAWVQTLGRDTSQSHPRLCRLETRGGSRWVGAQGPGHPVWT